MFLKEKLSSAPLPISLCFLTIDEYDQLLHAPAAMASLLCDGLYPNQPFLPLFCFV